MSTLQKLELKVPPAVVWFALAMLMKLSANVAPSLAFTPRHPSAIAMGLGGALVAGLGIISFRRARTTIDPRYPQNMSALVTSGVYRISRNPMYLGMLLVLAGWGWWLGHPLPFLFLPLFIAVLNRLQIAPEERALHRMFGAGFAAYCGRVRRWI